MTNSWPERLLDQQRNTVRLRATKTRCWISRPSHSDRRPYTPEGRIRLPAQMDAICNGGQNIVHAAVELATLVLAEP